MFFSRHHCHWWFLNGFTIPGPSPLNFFVTDQPLKLMVFQWFSQIQVRWSAMVLTLKRPKNAHNPILRQLCVLFRIQITLLLVNFRCKSTLKDSMFLRFKVGCCVCWTFSTLFCYHRKLSMVFKVTITIEWNGWGQPLGSMVFRWFWGKTTIGKYWFSMVVHHWSNDGMVMYHRRSLAPLNTV